MGQHMGQGSQKQKYLTVTRRHVSPHMLSQGNMKKHIAQEGTKIFCKLNYPPVVKSTKNIRKYSCVYFTWLLRKSAAYYQATMGQMALSPFQGTSQ